MMPILLLDQEKCLKNIERMTRKAQANRLSFRPHFKTHQSAEIGNWFRDFGVLSITVSSFRLARYFVESGWADILVAFPFIPQDIRELNALSKTARISILLDNPETLASLESLEDHTPYYVDIDTGYGRTGIKAENRGAIEELISASGANPRLRFKGFYCHAGHSYKCTDPMERLAIYEKAVVDLGSLKEHFAAYEPIVLYGDTPTCSTRDNFKVFDELTPGNFIFYDLTQVMLGTCSAEDIAVAMLCPVSGKYPDKKQLLIHGGGIHFSKESLQVKGAPVFGRVASNSEKGWEIPGEENFLTGLSQEHGVLEQCGSLFEKTGIGDNLMILPVHSCMTANLMKAYRTLDGKIITGISL